MKENLDVHLSRRWRVEILASGPCFAVRTFAATCSLQTVDAECRNKQDERKQLKIKYLLNI
jgi:hypothetical protein